MIFYFDFVSALKKLFTTTKKSRTKLNNLG